MISKKCQSAHDKAVDAGKNFYIDPETGYKVLTAQFLFDRGYCCGNGCRHCPYEEELIEEEEEVDIESEYDYNIN